VELEEYVGAPSISLTLEKQQNVENNYTDRLYDLKNTVYEILRKLGNEADASCDELNLYW